LRRLASLLAGGALFLLVGAIPALADGGPHSVTINSGSAGISSDSCAGCHRAHTAQGEMILVDEEPVLCLTCHGATGTGATTDVMNGIQYAVSTTEGEIRASGVLGALRGGGFENARIATDSAARVAYASGGNVRQLGMVPVRSTGQAVTSTHMNVADPTSAVVWGNGPISATENAGGTTTMTCSSCHNPHGNGQYRILNPIPAGSGGTMTASATAAPVDDAPLPSAGDQRNYTVMQKKGTEGTPSTYLLYASDVVAGGYAVTVGDYFHKQVPWNATSGSAKDAPNGKPTTFNGQINAWCAQCHTRYLTDPAVSHPQEVSSGDAIFTYRHGTTRNPCTTCHVAHGSNAQMTGVYSSTFPYPNATESASSRLLKIDNRGTCQACHDPTGTITPGTYIGPDPSPVVP